MGQGSNVVSKTIILDTCYYKLDTVSIATETFTISPEIPFQIKDNFLSTSCDSMDLIGRSFKVSYRTFDLDHRKTYALIDTTKLKSREKAVYIGYDFSPFAQSGTSPLIDQSNLNYNGSISRGFSVGNSQSLVLNSNLNLQLNGNLGNGINVVAAISDDNIPIQADGNTQLLQEFDKVFIRVSKDRLGVTAGDYDLPSGDGYFMNYFKKAQGLELSNTFSNDDRVISARANFAISRGKFSRQILEVSEGNQGPYKLRGNNGERFLIVLQGSEKVYYDGKLLVRGQDNDYVIDYNNAEIIFTPQRLIARESRIIVEYEYTDRNYLRTLYALTSSIKSDKYELNLNFYNEQDSKNATGQIELDSNDIRILTQGGENPSNLGRSGIRLIDDVNLAVGTIFYDKAPNPDGGDSILVYQSDPEVARFTAIFSEVGPGNGSYDIDSEAGANGRVYKYVGQETGTYEPIIQLIPPEKRQMVSLGSVYNFSDQAKVYGEFSFSSFDFNRFSEIGNQDNQGIASKVGFQGERSLGSKKKKWTTSLLIDYEFLQESFQFLNPFRNQEFTRDWNIIGLERADEHLWNGQWSINQGSKWKMDYRLAIYDRRNQYSGTRHVPSLIYRDSLNFISIKSDFLSSENSVERTSFSRPTIELERKFPKLDNWTLYGKYFSENNEITSINQGTLRELSFSFSEYYGAIRSPEIDNLQVEFFSKLRRDNLPENDVLAEAASVTELGMISSVGSSDNGIKLNLTFRDFKVSLPEKINEQDNKTLLGRIDYAFNIKNGLIRSISSYNIGSGQEAKREFQFVKVEKGEGNYVYLGDLNNDGEDQINEYETAVFSDQADFIRVSIINNEFIRTENQGWNQSISLDPSKTINRSATGLKGLLRKFNTQSTLRIIQKTESEGEGGLKLFQFSSQDTSLVSYNLNFNNTLFFNRGNALYDVQVGNRRNKNRFVQITGFEDRGVDEIFLRTRINPKSYIDFINEISIGDQTYDSEFFDNKDLDVDYITWRPTLNFRPKSNLKLALKYRYDTRKQRINELEEAQSHDITFETTWRQAAKSSLLFSISFVDINFSGEANTPVSYNLLSGLNDGNNFLWSINYTRRLAGNVDLNINYNGRKTGDNPTVHVARAQVRANF